MSKIIFEDNGNASISRLLRFAYNEDYKSRYTFRAEDTLWFANGNGSIRKLLEKWYDKDEEYSIYIDLVPDNNATLREYTKLLQYIQSNRYSNIHVLPIRCIEYYVLKFLCKNKYADIDISILTAIDYRLIRASKNSEHFYKDCLLSLKEVCKIPGGDNQMYGMFYRSDCLCEGKEDACSTITRMQKAWELVVELPAFIAFDTNVFFKTHKANIEQIISELIQDYKDRRSMLVELGYIEE